MRSVSFSDGGLRNRDIIFRDETDLVFCFLGCVVTFLALEANSWRGRASSNPGNWVCVFFSFLSLPTVLAFFLTINRTHSHKQVMPHAIPQTHSSFYPHRKRSPFDEVESFFYHLAIQYWSTCIQGFKGLCSWDMFHIGCSRHMARMYGSVDIDSITRYLSVGLLFKLIRHVADGCFIRIMNHFVVVMESLYFDLFFFENCIC